MEMDMYEGYSAGMLAANPQKRRERSLEEQLDKCEREVKRLRARILELEEALDSEEERWATPLMTDPLDTDDPTDYSDNAPEDWSAPEPVEGTDRDS